MDVELTDVDKPFKLQGWAAEFIELTYLGIPYRIPHKVEGKPTIRKAIERKKVIHNVE